MLRSHFLFVLVGLCAGVARAGVKEKTWGLGSIQVACLDLGRYVANCYVVSSSNKAAYVIDPGGHPDEVQGYLDRKGLKVSGYLITHAHTDHIRALSYLREALPAPAGIHVSDLPLFKKRVSDPGPAFELFLNEGKTYGAGDLEFSVIHTPGHSPGSICLHFKKGGVLFSGDTLFLSGIGRTDLEGGSDTQIERSLRKLSKLPADTRVFPGHGDSTSVGTELL